MAALRHQWSLESVIDFGSQGPLFANAEKRARAVARFYDVIGHFAAIETNNPYNRAALIRLTFEYARSAESQDRFLAFFFQSLAIGLLDGEVAYSDPGLDDAFYGVAEFLMNNFFLPCRYSHVHPLGGKPADESPVRVSIHKTPQPSPAHHSAIRQVLSQAEQQRMDDSIGTPERISALRASCLVRDRNRCVATHTFNQAEALARFEEHGQALDDDRNPFVDGQLFESLQVAHIIPYALTKADDGSRLGEGKKAAVAILNMFDLGVAHLIEGVDINRPYNALTLSNWIHENFGTYKIFFEPVSDADGAPPSTYRISTFLPPGFARSLPVVRSLFTHPSIDPPSQRLLALHCAIAHILHLSGAGGYIEQILRDMEDGIIRADGSTELGLMVDLALRVH